MRDYMIQHHRTLWGMFKGIVHQFCLGSKGLCSFSPGFSYHTLQFWRTMECNG